MKRGFTLVELLAVVVIIAIIAVLGIGGVNRVRNNINSEMCNSTVKLIENGATHYGEDFKNMLNSTCVVNGTTYNKCTIVKVDDLINWGYINVKEVVIIDEGTNEEVAVKRLVNDATNEELNNKFVQIYLDNDIVYANVLDVTC